MESGLKAVQLKEVSKVSREVNILKCFYLYIQHKLLPEFIYLRTLSNKDVYFQLFLFNTEFYIPNSAIYKLNNADK